MISRIFSYCLCSQENSPEGFDKAYPFGIYRLFTDARTPCDLAHTETAGCAILGYAVNVITGDSEHLANQMLSECSDMQALVAFEKQLGGKYVIFCYFADAYYILPDATGSIPVFYNTERDLICTNNMQRIVRKHGFTSDARLQKIRSSGDISQAMPFDVTPFREIKQLLPNHYLDLNLRKSVRFVNAYGLQPEISAEQATEMVRPMIETLVSFYQNRLKLYCPITSGRDSRVVLAYLSEEGRPAECYTIRHDEHRGDEQDLVIPTQMCSQLSIPHRVIADEKVPNWLVTYADDLLGEGTYSHRTLKIAYTIAKHFGDGAVVNGDIIGQVGKCSLHRDIPECFATPGYFRCKLHNYSSEAKTELGHWLKEIKESAEQINPFDLFSVENRLGRWAAQTYILYGAIGQVQINIFNSRSIIYTWTAVSRKNRKNSEIHIDLIKKRIPYFLSTPFESDKSLSVKICKATGINYLIASYIKYFIENVTFKSSEKRSFF